MLQKFLSLPFKSKIRYSLIGGGVLLLFSYQMAISPTIEEWQKNKLFKQSVSSGLSAKAIRQQKKNLELINARLKSNVNNREELRTNLLAYISEKSDLLNLNLVNLPILTRTKEQDFDLYINKFELEGSYESLVRLLKLAEQEQNFAQVVSVEFAKIKNRSLRKEQLIMSLYLQSILFKEK